MTVEPRTPHPVYRVSELAAFLGWSEDTIRREIRDGHLRARKLRADTVITAADLEAWIDSLPVDPDYAANVEPSTALPAVMPLANAERPTRGRVQRRFEILPPAAREAAE